MKITDINKQDWTVLENVEKIVHRARRIRKEEQECHILSPATTVSNVECSNQDFIRRFARTPFFILNRVCYNKDTGFVLSVNGILKNECLFFRKKLRRELTTEEKKEHLERLKSKKKKSKK